MTPAQNPPVAESVELLPCPFCGGEPRPYTANPYPGFEDRQVQCDRCGASAFDRKWNIRADPAIAAAYEAGRAEGWEVLDRPEAVGLIAKAIEQGDINYGMRLTRLVDGESTYTLTYSDGREPLEFPDTDELYEHVRATKRSVQAGAVLAAIRALSKEPTK